MKIIVVNGTSVQGVTHYMKDLFLRHMCTADGNEIVEFYPKDLPPFCVGCKSCFLKGEETCPHFAKTDPVWRAMLEADLLVFAYPVYALRAPASIKSLLDHLCVHWMVHRPDPKMFQKTAVILTNSVGAPNGSAQKDVRTSLSWMGVSRVYACGAGMMGDIFIEKMTEPHRRMLAKKMERLAGRAAKTTPRRRKSPRVGLLFSLCRLQHKMVLKSETTPSLDNAYYLQNGWIRAKSAGKRE